MTLERWLTAALHNLAPDIRRRLDAEYREYVQGAVEMGRTQAQALADLGDPGLLNRTLLATHLSDYESRVLQSRVKRWTPRALWAPLVYGATWATLLWLMNPAAPAHHEGGRLWALAPLAVGALTTGGLLALRWHLRNDLERLALYCWPSLTIATVCIFAAAQAVVAGPSWPRLLGFVIGGAALSSGIELITRRALYRKARQSGWRPR